MSDRYQPADDVLAVRVGQETVLWSESSQSLHLLDPVATAVWEFLQQDDVEKTIEGLSTLFQAPADQVREDVAVLLARLRSQSLLVSAANR